MSLDTATGPSLGTLLVAAGIVSLVATLGVSAAFSPSIGTEETGDRTQETLVGIHGGGLGLHEYGSVQMLRGTEIAWSEDSAGSYFEVTMVEDGTVVAGFMDSGYEDCAPYDSPCSHTGFRIIDPGPDPEVISEWGFPVRTPKNSEVHDAEPLPGGGYVVGDMEHERVMIVEDGEITWQWNASSFYDPPADPTKTDWLHINDVDRIGDGRFLVSVRNANQLLIVERGAGVMEVINEDADPDDDKRRGDPAVMDHQHNPHWLGDGHVLVADSENNRIVELRRNADGEWESVWTFDSAEGVDLDWPRDADRLPNGNTLITDSSNQRVFEINESGDVVWSVQTDQVPYQATRLPWGEQVGVLNNSTDVPDNREVRGVTESETVPVLTPLLGVAKKSYPLPFWYQEEQLGASLLSLGLIVTGLGLRVRRWFA